MPQSKTLTLTVDSDLDEAGIEQALNDNFDEVESFIIGETEMGKSLGTYTDDTFEIESIEAAFEPNQYYLHYNYSWHAYFGCDDMDKAEDSNNSADFSYVGNQIVIRMEELVERFPNEEF